MFKYPMQGLMNKAIHGYVVRIGDVRAKLRQKGEYELADEIRAILNDLVYDIEDNGDKFTILEQHGIATSNKKQWYIYFSCEGDDFPYRAKDMVHKMEEISMDVYS